MKKIISIVLFSSLVLYLIGDTANDFIGTRYDHKLNARLDKLEAASTTAQQPQERHYLDTLEWYRYAVDSTLPEHYSSDGFYKYRESITYERKRINIK